MNKSLATNLICLAVAALGWSQVLPYMSDALFFGGIFGFSGAITNQLAVHMLFEKVPLMYGSGVISARFESFKFHIGNIILNTFFSEENFRSNMPELKKILVPDTGKLAESVDTDSVFETFKKTVLESKFGGMLGMFGGGDLIEGLRGDFKEKFQEMLPEIIESSIRNNIDLTSGNKINDLKSFVESLVKEKLEELTPEEVKQIVEKIIREHLGWLVLWGGVVGFAIGFASSFVI